MSDPQQKSSVCKLSRGLVRQELRQLDDELLIKKICTTLDSWIEPRKRISLATAEKIERIISALMAEYAGVVLSTDEMKVGGIDVSQPYTIGFYFQKIKVHMTPAPGLPKSDFEEDLLEVRCYRYNIGRRRQIIDDFSTGFTITTHALIRLIERKACEREALALVKNHLSYLVGASTLFLVCNDLPFERAMIPFANGLLMMSGMVLQDKTPSSSAVMDGATISHLRRILFDQAGSGMQAAPDEVKYPLLRKGTERIMAFSMRTATYIPFKMLTIDQKWCYTALMALFRDHADKVQYLSKIVTHSEIYNRNSEEVTPIFDDLSKIVASPFWKRYYGIE